MVQRAHTVSDLNVVVWNLKIEAIGVSDQVGVQRLFDLRNANF